MSDFFDLIFSGLASRALWAGVFSLTAFLGIGVYHQERRKFAGKWRMTIQWSPEHAENLFGEKVAEPHSVGNVSVSYGLGPKNNQYWGIAYFELFSGTKRFAHLCVELEDMHVRWRWLSNRFPFVRKAELEGLNLRALIRKPIENFDYGEWSRYAMAFNESSSRCLTGEMILVERCETVGIVTAKRVG